MTEIRIKPKGNEKVKNVQFNNLETQQTNPMSTEISANNTQTSPGNLY